MYSVLLDDKIAQDNTCHTTTFALQYLRDVLGLCGQIVNVRFKSKPYCETASIRVWDVATAFAKFSESYYIETIIYTNYGLSID